MVEGEASRRQGGGGESETEAPGCSSCVPAPPALAPPVLRRQSGPPPSLQVSPPRFLDVLNFDVWIFVSLEWGQWSSCPSSLCLNFTPGKPLLTGCICDIFLKRMSGRIRLEASGLFYRQSLMPFRPFSKKVVLTKGHTALIDLLCVYIFPWGGMQLYQSWCQLLRCHLVWEGHVKLTLLTREQDLNSSVWCKIPTLTFALTLTFILGQKCKGKKV